MSLLFPNRFETFRGYEFSLASWCEDFPFLTLKNETCIGSNLDLFTDISHDLDFKFQVQLVPVDEEWGSFVNGNWTGMLADLAYRNKEILVNAFVLTEERGKGFDFTYPFHQEGFAVLVAYPPERPKWMGLIDPFQAMTWALIIGSMLAVFASFYIMLVIRKSQPLDLSYTGLVVRNFIGIS